MERRPDMNLSVDVHRSEITLPKRIPVLRFDRDITLSGNAVAGQQGIHRLLAVDQALTRDVGLQGAALPAETLERVIGQFGRQDLGLLVVRRRNIEFDIIHFRLLC